MPTIRQGHHRPWLPPLGLFYSKASMDRCVRFGESCRYFLKGADQLDTNKLFGVGYFPDHHRESARFGWRYDPEPGTGRGGHIVLSAYCYVQGQRLIEELCTVPIGKWVRLYLAIGPVHYFFDVVEGHTGRRLGSTLIKKGHARKWGYPMGLYFGGNQPAPHTLSVTLEKL